MLLRAPLTTLAVLAIAPCASAQGEQPSRDELKLEYQPSRSVMSTCPPAEYFYDEMQVRLGFKLFQVTAPNILVVKVDRIKDRFQSTFDVYDATGNSLLSNTFLERNCTAALRDVIVTIAIHYTRLPDPVRCVPDPVPPAPSSPPTQTLPPPAPLPLPERLRIQAGLSSVFAIGKAPVIVGGAGLFFGVRWRDISAAVEGRALFAPAAGIAGTSLSYSFMAASAVLCGHVEWGFACVRGEAGVLSGRSAKGYTEPNHVSSPGLALRLARDWAVTPKLAIRPYAEFMVEGYTVRMVSIARSDALWVSWPLSASIGIGLVMPDIGHSLEVK